MILIPSERGLSYANFDMKYARAWDYIDKIYGKTQNAGLNRWLGHLLN